MLASTAKLGKALSQLLPTGYTHHPFCFVVSTFRVPNLVYLFICHMERNIWLPERKFARRTRYVQMQLPNVLGCQQDHGKKSQDDDHLAFTFSSFSSFSSPLPRGMANLSLNPLFPIPWESAKEWGPKGRKYRDKNGKEGWTQPQSSAASWVWSIVSREPEVH